MDHPDRDGSPLLGLLDFTLREFQVIFDFRLHDFRISNRREAAQRA
jgi:hypothetical protein